MDNIDDKCVDNYEDNCVEINQNEKVDVPQWVTTWAEYILNQYLSSDDLNEQSINTIEQVLMASTIGDSCIDLKGNVIQDLSKLLVSAELAEQQVAPFVYDQNYLYLYRYWQLEQRLAQQVYRLKQQTIVPADCTKYEKLLTDPFQKQALEMVSRQALSMITGGPGTGKTYTLARIIAVLNESNHQLRIAMAAPTGKAAQRMKEALQNSLNDDAMLNMGLDIAHLKQQNTLTIHRLLGLGHSAQPKYSLKKPLPYDVVVIDEASMLDLNLATMLFEAIPDQCRLILLGDAQQLASVDVGMVLADLQQVKALKDHHVNLVTSRRFKAGAKIGDLARFIQSHECSPQSSKVDVLAKFEKEICRASEIQQINLAELQEDLVQLEYLNKAYSDQDLKAYYLKLSSGFTDYFKALNLYVRNGYQQQDVTEIIQKFDDYRILAAVRHGHLGLNRLNDEIERELFQYMRISRHDLWYIGRPVMMTYNDYQLGLSNGDIGICLRHRQFADQFEVYFPSLDQWFPASRLPKSMQTCYALSIHKSQGSEFKHTAVVLDEFASRLLSQELLYTAITRAKKAVSLLVDTDALFEAINVKTIRKTGLLNKLNTLFISNI